MINKKLIFLIAVFFALLAIFLPGFSRLQELKEENRSLEERIEVLIKVNESLKKEKENLETDPVYAEKIAREKLGMAKKGEIILK